MPNFDFGGEIAWRPNTKYTRECRLKRFMDDHGIATVDELLQRSTTDLEWFWNAVLKDLGIEFYQSYSQVLDLSRGAAWPRWCVGGKMNIVHNCLDKWTATPAANRTALLWEGEDGKTGRLSYGELHREVNRLANGLRELGIGSGDVVGLYMPMIPEIAVGLLAVGKIGAVVLPLFSGFGADALATRLSDGRAKALLTCDGFHRRGQWVAMKQAADSAIERVASLRHSIVLCRSTKDTATLSGRDRSWRELTEKQSTHSATEPTGADDPLMILYTSGTTGRPKGALHTHCGFPVKAAQDMAHGLDLRSSDNLYWVPDMG